MKIKTMKYKLLVVLLFVSIIGRSQRVEMSLSANSGLFYLGGADKESAINWNNGKRYTNDPWGGVPALSYGVSLDIRRASAKGFLAGADLGLEKLRSRTSITHIWTTENVTATGRTILSTDAINLFPYLGKRIYKGDLMFDISAGTDIAWILAIKERGNAKDESGMEYETSLDRKTINWDLRPRLQFAVRKKDWGGYLGYSYGLNNYRSGNKGSNEFAAARYLRLGLTYRLK